MDRSTNECQHVAGVICEGLRTLITLSSYIVFYWSDLQLHASPMIAIHVMVQTVILGFVTVVLTAMEVVTAVLMWLMLIAA